MQHANRFLKLVNEAKARIRETNVQEVKKRMDKGERLILVDVREDNEVARGRIPGALHLGKGVIERDVEKAIPDANAEVILYCGGGFRSALAADALRQMGYTNAVSMDGGWKAWNENGYPTAKE
jgi:rhodanese-related sulfurtransferase